MKPSINFLVSLVVKTRGAPSYQTDDSFSGRADETPYDGNKEPDGNRRIADRELVSVSLAHGGEGKRSNTSLRLCGKLRNIRVFNYEIIRSIGPRCLVSIAVTTGQEKRTREENKLAIMAESLKCFKVPCCATLAHDC